MSKLKLFSGFAFLVVLLSACNLGAAPDTALQPLGGGDKRELHLTSGVENTAKNTIALPIFKGRSGNKTFWYVVTESSDKKDARRRGVNWSPKLRNAAGTRAVQGGRLVDGVLELARRATVDFSPKLIIEPGPNGFPPKRLQPGSVGEANYTPLVQLPGGHVLNASHIANRTGLGDRVVAIDYEARRVTLREVAGFYDDDEVFYVSLEASARDAAALENATFAPNLNAAPRLGSNERNSARSGLVLVINGQTGVDNSNRQGLTSALLGEGGSLNVLQGFPEDQDYSPLWDVYPTVYTRRAIARDLNINTLQTDFDDVAELAEDGFVTGPEGVRWGPGGFIVNCPAVSEK